MFNFAMTSGLASDSDKFKITITLLGFLTPAMRQFGRFFKLDKYAMFSFAMTSGLASDSDKFKITITLLGFLTPSTRQFCSVF